MSSEILFKKVTCSCQFVISLAKAEAYKMFRGIRAHIKCTHLQETTLVSHRQEAGLGVCTLGLMLHGTGAVDLAAATISKGEEILTGRTVTPALTVSLLQKATSSSVLPSDSSGLHPNMGLAKGGLKHNYSVFFH